jgi:hypothetical protein
MLVIYFTDFFYFKYTIYLTNQFDFNVKFDIMFSSWEELYEWFIGSFIKENEKDT